MSYNEIITNQIEIEFDGIHPRDTLTLEEFSSRLTNIFRNTNSQIFQQNNNNLTSILLPKDSSGQEFLLSQTLDADALTSFHCNTLVFNQLVNELTQCIESTATSIVLESLINESFHFIMNKVGIKTIAKKTWPRRSATVSNGSFRYVDERLLPRNASNNCRVFP